MQDSEDEQGNVKAPREHLGGLTLHPVPESVPRARRWFRTLIAQHEPACSIDDCLLSVGAGRGRQLRLTVSAFCPFSRG
jgi:hypothetical protein